MKRMILLFMLLVSLGYAKEIGVQCDICGVTNTQKWFEDGCHMMFWGYPLSFEIDLCKKCTKKYKKMFEMAIKKGKKK